MERQQSDNRPIFIIGSGRSGTSVLTWALGQHPNILPLPETHWIARLGMRMSELYNIGTVNEKFSHLGALDWDEDQFFAAFGRAIDQFVVDTREPRLRFIRKQYAQLRSGQVQDPLVNAKTDPLPSDSGQIAAKSYHVVRSPSDPKLRWIDGTPENTFYVYALNRMFPDARFLHLLRNPDQVARSYMNFSNTGTAAADLAADEAYQKWTRYVEFALKSESALGSEFVLRVDYQRLVEAPEETLTRCLDFVGESFSEDCLLPLNKRINSSFSEEDRRTQESIDIPAAQQARALYASALAQLPSTPQHSAFDELKHRYQQYARDLNQQWP